MKTVEFVYVGLISISFFIVLSLNKRIYKKEFFKYFIPISMLMILTGVLIKDKFEINFYKLLIVVPILVYLVKITQLGFGYFGKEYKINIRGWEDENANGFPTIDTVFTGILGVLYGIMFLMIK